MHCRRLKFYYLTELSKHDSSIKYKTNLESLDLQHLIKDLRKRVLDVGLLKRLTTDFGWDYQALLISQLRTLLSCQQLEIKIKPDVFGKDEISIKPTVEGIRTLCEPYLKEVINRELLATKLNLFMKEVREICNDGVDKLVFHWNFR